MILSGKVIKPVSAGAHVATIKSFDYAKDEVGNFLRTKSNEKGLECTFHLKEADVEMYFIFWLTPNSEYQLKLFNKAVLGVNSKTLFLKELKNKRVIVVVQKEVLYKKGELVSDFNGNPIFSLKLAPRFFPYNNEKIPILPEKELIVTKFLDEERNVIYEKEGSI